MRNRQRERTSCLLVAILFVSAGAVSAAAEPEVVNQAQIGSKTAVPGAPIYMDDRLRTGSDARLQVTFRDKSVLTLGEKANVIVDRYVFDPEKKQG